MTTYARVIGGITTDVCVTPPELKDRFNPEWLAAHLAEFVIVPDGTLHGATDNGDGTYTNPAPPKPTPQPQPPATVAVNIAASDQAALAAVLPVLQAIVNAQIKAGS